jgi:hypothetical protein
MNKLFDSFDAVRKDQMDWRSFLCLLTIVMQPRLACKNHVRSVVEFRYKTCYCNETFTDMAMRYTHPWAAWILIHQIR